jgi:Na+-transporting methylmalonyl-CoA/oxaloacetate decarboxylase gamma subunit
MGIFENKHYPAVMYVLITVASLAIFFSFVSIFVEVERTTGLVIQEDVEQNITEPEEVEAYSLNAYGYFYLLIAVTLILITIFAATLILPKFKDKT